MARMNGESLTAGLGSGAIGTRLGEARVPLSADPNRWPTIAAFSQASSAHVARIQLRAAGVPCIFSDRNHMEIPWLPAHVGDVILRVPPEHSGRARDIINRLAGSLTPRPVPVAPVMGYTNPLIVSIVAIAHFKDVPEAHMAASVLAAGGVACGIVEPLGQQGRSDHPATLAVSIEDTDRAVAVLANTPASRNLLGNAAGRSPAPVLGVACPRCASPGVAPAPRGWQAALGVLGVSWLLWLGLWGQVSFLVLAGLWLLAMLGFRPLRCRSCGHEFRPATRNEPAAARDADLG